MVTVITRIRSRHRPTGDTAEAAPTAGTSSLFDSGYVTATPDFRLEVGRRIRDEYENGKEYYRLHGQIISTATSVLSKPAGQP